MPYARISLRKGKSKAYLTALSDAVHQALVERFEVPPDDRFQILHQLEPEELVFDRGYLGGPRSDDFVHVAVTTGRHRTAEVKRSFYARLVELLAETPGLRPEDVLVVISESRPEDWSFGGGRPWEPGEPESTKEGGADHV